MKHLRLFFVLALVCALFLNCIPAFAAADNSTDYETIQGYVNVSDVLNFREGPSEQSTVICKLNRGTILKLIGSSSNGWYKAMYKNKIGYVSDKYIMLSSHPEYELKACFITIASNDANRCYNMKLASSKINNTLLLPGEEFDWFKVVGNANQHNGYKEAYTIYGDQYVLDFGGGVCQVSTTLYNLINKVGIEADESHGHSLNVSYIEDGMLDASVSSSSNMNFRFTNTLDYSILINMQCDDSGRVYAELYKIV